MKFCLLILILFFHGVFADNIANRTSWLKKFSTSKDCLPILLEGIKSNDVEIQAKAVYEYFQLKKDAVYPELLRLTNKSSDQLARVLICCAENLKDKNLKAKLLTAIAKGTTSPSAALEANRKNFSFHKINVRLQDRKDWDFNIEKIMSKKIPENNWKSFYDKDSTGHMKGFYQVNYNDKNWKKALPRTLKYQPLVWYRIKFDAPKKPVCNAAELNFAGVESAAWVWLNGTFVGARVDGQAAWQKPFALDITKEISWGKENTLVVRVSSADATDSGIFKPITLDVLK